MPAAESARLFGNPGDVLAARAATWQFPPHSLPAGVRNLHAVDLYALTWRGREGTIRKCRMQNSKCRNDC